MLVVTPDFWNHDNNINASEILLHVNEKSTMSFQYAKRKLPFTRWEDEIYSFLERLWPIVKFKAHNDEPA